MRGDVSRETFRTGKHFSRVVLQQGRAILDADFNEAQAIQQHRTEVTTADSIGATGTPKDDPGFGLRVTSDQSGLMIEPGRYYVNGILCENEAAVPQAAQVDLFPRGAPLNVVELLQDAGASIGLVYLDVWQRHISRLEDPAIADVALGGADTATRLKTIWQVKVLPLRSIELDDALHEQIVNALQNEATVPTDLFDFFDERDELIALSSGRLSARAENGYARSGNHLYRIEVHQGGALHTATFKWSRENGSWVLPIGARRVSGRVLPVSGLDDRVTGGMWAEIIDEESELQGLPGVMVEIAQVDLVRQTVELREALPDEIGGVNLRLRLWDHTGDTTNGLRMTRGWLDLEDGLSIRFSGGHFRTGDYWLIPARAAVHDIDWPDDAPQPPMGIRHDYADLGVVFVHDETLHLLHDARRFFPSLTNLTASDVAFGDETLRDVNTVRDALQKLSKRQLGGGTSTITLTPDDDLAQRLESLADGQSAHICFHVGDYHLDDPLVIANAGHIQITGAGPGTSLQSPTRGAALHFENCQSVTVRDLALASGSIPMTQGLPGVMTAFDCGKVTVEHVSFRSAPGSQPASGCLLVQHSPDYANQRRNRGGVQVRHCDFSIGHLQSGIAVHNGAVVHIEGNTLYASDISPQSRLINALKEDEAYRDQIRHLMIRDVEVYELDADDSAGFSSEGERITLHTNLFGVSFETNGALALDKAWEAAFLEQPPVGVSSPVELEAYVYDIANQVLENEGAVGDFTEFLPFFRILDREDSSVASDGILISGGVGVVRVVNNTIFDALSGIQVVPDGSDSVDRVHITGNTIITQLPPVGGLARHTAYVRQAAGLIFADNEIVVYPGRATTGQTLVGLHVEDHVGHQLLIRHNHIQNFSHGVIVEGGRKSARDDWQLEGNVIEGQTVETVVVD